MHLRLFFACLLLSLNPLLAQDCESPPTPSRVAKVFVRRVVFENAAALDATERQEISAAVRGSEKSLPSQNAKELGTLAEEAGERLRAAYQNKGYFKVEAEGTLVPATEGEQTQFDIVLRVLHRGDQYRMGDLRFVHAVQFSEPELRNQFAIERGEIFSRTKIAEGLEALRRLYDSRGYINYTGVPFTEFQEGSDTANLTVGIDEGRQFRLRSITFLGLDAATEARTKDALEIKPGDVYSTTTLEGAVEKLGGAIRADDPERVSKKLDEKDGWVDVALDFRSPRPCVIDLSGAAAITIRHD
jgi:outer membrane protein assembly factor BamA